MEDRNGTLWVGTNLGGAARFAGGRFTLLSPAEGLPHHDVRAFLEDRGRNVWIATIGGGLTRVAPNGSLRYSPSPTGFRRGASSRSPRERRRDLARLVRGRRDAAGRGRGQVFTTENGLSSNRVIALRAEPDGTVWAGTSGGGLNRIRGGKGRAGLTRDGLFDDLVR
ncbi:MAG: hypothetical protein IPN03_17335 [Holophagales bacterium]|nr:hypothetical protein [Holophagales bacterium]